MDFTAYNESMTVTYRSVVGDRTFTISLWRTIDIEQSPSKDLGWDWTLYESTAGGGYTIDRAEWNARCKTQHEAFAAALMAWDAFVKTGDSVSDSVLPLTLA